MKPSFLNLTVFVLAVMSYGSVCVATEQCTTQVRDGDVWTIRLDNDLFGQQDQGYSNGLHLDLASPQEGTNQCIGPLRTWASTLLEEPTTPAQRTVLAVVSHAIYTPTDSASRGLIERDRPYAAILMFGVGISNRESNRLSTTMVQVGLVGPSARGAQVQNGFHSAFGGRRFEGWEHQLRDEPLIELVHERSRRTRLFSSRWSADAIGRYGGGLGNLATYVSAGGEVRFGRYLHDDFGSNPLRPTSSAGRFSPSWTRATAFHLFLSLDARLVAHDLTLDGNAFKRSHSVEKTPWVGEVGIGLVLTQQRWKITLARFARTREFSGQQEMPKFGSLAVSYAF